jgi:hypothetical protein
MGGKHPPQFDATDLAFVLQSVGQYATSVASPLKAVEKHRAEDAGEKFSS